MIWQVCTKFELLVFGTILVYTHLKNIKYDTCSGYVKARINPFSNKYVIGYEIEICYYDLERDMLSDMRFLK